MGDRLGDQLAGRQKVVPGVRGNLEDLEVIQARLTLKENRVRKAAGETGIVNDKIAGHEVVRVGDRQIVDRSDLRGLDALNAIEQNVAVPVQLGAAASDGIEGLPQLLGCDLFLSVDPDFIEEPQNIVLSRNRQFGAIEFVLEILVPDDADDAKPQQRDVEPGEQAGSTWNCRRFSSSRSIRHS